MPKSAELFDVEGHSVIVTGAASGLGLAIAEVFADAGATVTAVDLDAQSLARLEPRMRTVALDVSDFAGVAAVVTQTAAATGRLDAVFANAGISAGPGFAFMESGRLENLDLAHWQKVLDTNLTSVAVLMRAAVGPMKERRYGRIVVTSSVGGIQAEPTVGYAYSATKAAVNNLVRHAAIEACASRDPRERDRAGPVPHEHRRRAHAPPRGRGDVRLQGAARPRRRAGGAEGPRALPRLPHVQLRHRHRHPDRRRRACRPSLRRRSTASTRGYVDVRGTKTRVLRGGGRHSPSSFSTAPATPASGCRWYDELAKSGTRDQAPTIPGFGFEERRGHADRFRSRARVLLPRPTRRARDRARLSVIGSSLGGSIRGGPRR